MLKCLPALVMICLLASTTTSMVTARSAMGSSLQNLDPGQRVDVAKAEVAESADDGGPSIWSDFSMMYRTYQQCSGENLSVCLKIKLLMGLEKVFRHSKELRISDWIKFVKSEAGGTPSVTASPVMDEKSIESVLPRSMEGKEDTLTQMILNKVASFLQDHNLQVKFPDPRMDSSVTEESRRKKDKKGGGAYIMIPLLLGGTFIPIAYGALAMLAGKALIVSKLALVLASIIGIKKLLNSGGHKESQHEVVVSSGGHSSGWGRDIDLAYSAYEPKNLKKHI